MKFGVTPQTLLITAGLVWLIAGANILHIGISYWLITPEYWLLKVCETSFIFLLFFGIIFRKLYRKHTQRISKKKTDSCPFSFFDIQGWLTMTFMITTGVTIRKLHILPESFIAIFYTGLSLALMATGIRFIFYIRKS